MNVPVTATEVVSFVRTGDPTGFVRAFSPALVRVGRPFPSGHAVWDAEAPPRGSARPIQSPWSAIRAETSTNVAGETVALPRSFGGISLTERSEAPRSEPEDSPGPQKGWVLPVDLADDLLSGKVPQVVRAEGVPRDELFGRPVGKGLESVQTQLLPFLPAGAPAPAPATNRVPNRSVLDAKQPETKGGRTDTVVEAASDTLADGGAARFVRDAPTTAEFLVAINHARGAIGQLAVLSLERHAGRPVRGNEAPGCSMATWPATLSAAPWPTIHDA